MQCVIKWNTLSLPEWETRFAAIRRATLPQSYDYARAACSLLGQRARWGLICIDGVEAGLVQILEAGILQNIIHAVVLDCGPLWFEGFGSPAHITAFFAAFALEFPARPGRRRRIIPEIAEGDKAAQDLAALGYRRRPRPGYSTVWLDLTKDRQDLRGAMKPQWRNKLRKAEKANLRIEWDETGRALESLLTKYQSDKAKKGYDGPSPALLRSMAKVFCPPGRFIIGRAFLNDGTLEDETVAAILVLCHGTSATYQVGWSTGQGRKTAAHNLLLWQAACRLKDKGYRDFDLGGINEDAQGLTEFKQAMGGQTVACAGHYF